MSYKTILVHADGNARNERLAVAARLAEAHDAHLVGLHVTPRLDLPGYIVGELPASVRAIQARYAREAADEARRNFERAAAATGRAEKGEWREAEGEPGQVLALHMRYADLAVISQDNPEDTSADERGLAGTLALAGGRPVLAVPYIGKYPKLGERVLLCWNASREAARAVCDALPVLTKAKNVTVLVVNPRSAVTGHGAQPGADVALYLARHGVKVEATEAHTDELDPADLILSRASDLSVDLIVMGAYGRSRWREVVLGGVTRGMLAHMTVPVLMAH